MFPSSSLLTTVLLALSVSGTPLTPREGFASPPPSAGLPFSMKLSLHGKNLAELDRARASHFFSHGKQVEALKSGQMTKRAASLNVTNNAVQYTANVNIGNPATSYTLLIDTGSSNTWVSIFFLSFYPVCIDLY